MLFDSAFSPLLPLLPPRPSFHSLLSPSPSLYVEREGGDGERVEDSEGENWVKGEEGNRGGEEGGSGEGP